MRKQIGFTLLELLLVISIVGVVAGVISMRLGTANYWKEEGEVRKLAELIEFVFHQANIDGYYYRINFAFGRDNDSYQIGILGDEETQSSRFSRNELELQGDANLNQNINPNRVFTEDLGILSQELAFFLQPTRGRSQSMLPPPELPSLEQPFVLPSSIRIIDVRTPRGVIQNEIGESAWLDFSPRGFSEFGVIHLVIGDNRPITILINPFTGLTTIYREFRDFDWVWGKQES